jgi:hypothetical protein
MVESFKDLLPEEAKSPEEIDKVLQEKLGIGLAEMSQALSDSVLERADEFAEELMNIAPYGDYSKLTEDSEVIVKFLKEEATKLENWKIQFIEAKKEKDQLIEFVFFNKSVDDGDILKGFVFVGLSGKIRHAFAQVNS